MSQDERMKRAAGQEDPRASRASMDRDSRSSSDPVARNIAAGQWVAEALPTPPTLPGYHTIWLSTTNQQDPIYKRERLGYVAVKPDEIQDFQHMKITSGQHEGCIGYNEMVLYKIDLDRYASYMREFHHDMPLQEEERFGDVTEMRDGRGRVIGMVEGDGLAKSKAPPPEPVFE